MVPGAFSFQTWRFSHRDAPAMNRVVRNRLASLLLGAFRDPAKRDAILRLEVYCELCRDEDGPRVSAPHLDAVWAKRHPEPAMRPGGFAEAIAELKGVIEVSGGIVVRGSRVHVRESQNSNTLWYEPHPDVQPFLAAVGDRVRIYAQVVRENAMRLSTLDQLEPLRRGIAEAAILFNAGLFFEAHEHLEDHWRPLPPSSIKRFVQGILQVSVGFHHAMRGSYQGAVNQLGKALAKLAAAPEDALGLDRDRFVREVEAARQEIVARGRQQMRPASLHELPRMHLRF